MTKSSVENKIPDWDETNRLAALHNFEILGTGPEPAFDDIVKLARELCQAPMALVGFIDGHQQWFKAGADSGVGAMPRDELVCIVALRQNGVFIVPDLSRDPRFRHLPVATGDRPFRFYAGAVMRTAEGLPLGTVCVLDTKPRPEGLTTGQAEALEALARSAVRQLENTRSEKSLAAEERQWRTFLDALPQKVWSTGYNGHQSYFNRRWFEYTGMSEGSIERENWDKFLHPDDRNENLGKWSHSVQTGKPYDTQFRLRNAAGEYRWVLGRGLPVRGKNGVIERWVGTCTDIHDLKLAESRLAEREAYLKCILETVPDAMIIINERGLIQFFSAAAVKMFGYEPKEIVGTNIKFLMPPPYREQHDANLRRHRESDVERNNRTGRVVVAQRKDGSTFPIELQIGEMVSGNERFYTGFVRDLTERQEAEGQMQQLQSEIIHMSRMTALGEMASTLAHEINQPLTAISTYLKGSRRILERMEGQEVAVLRDAVNEAAEQALRAGEVIRHLRDFVARGESEREIHNVRRLVEEASALALVGVREKGVRVDYDFPLESLLVVVDRIQVQQVLFNLIRNAVEAMQEVTERDLLIKCEVLPDEEVVAITVRDTGPGIKPEILSRLFQPFNTSKPTGMGVGLSICRTIIESHGGKIWVGSSAGMGTSFHLTLRLVSEEEIAQVE